MQNVAAAVVGAAIAVYGLRRRASPTRGLAITIVAVVLLLATLAVEGVQGVHRWIRIGSLTIHVASLSIPLVLVELDRILRDARLAIAFAVLLTVAATLAMQPDAGQATAFAGAGILLLAVHWKRNRIAVAVMLALLTLAGLSFLRNDPLAPVPHVEEIASRIAQQGAAWAAAVVIALTLPIVPFVTRTNRASTSAGLAVAVYLALATAASYWGHFPVPVLGYGMSPIIGYFAGWAWLRATGD
jgi:cell division protein FtsW (lipid II flippase)